MKNVLNIFRAGTPAARAVVTRLAGRLAALENLDTAEYRKRVRALFGRYLNPEEVVHRILGDVRRQGDRAVWNYARRIDRVRIPIARLRVTDAERRAAYRRTPAKLRKALRRAAERIAEYQHWLLPENVRPRASRSGASGVRCGLTWYPLQRAGVYVPGGTAAYPSSVLMNAIPAQVAGVQEIAIATPCGPNGELSDGVLCACEIIGAHEIYRVGGAQAIAALAFGTDRIPKVQKIVGPGNLFVMLAKRAVFGHVDIDMLAGPSEVLVLADETARADWVAADLLAQAEHDALAACILVTTSAGLARAVQQEIEHQLADLPRKSIAARSLCNWGAILLARSLREAIALANDLAPEHLEIHTRKPAEVARQLTCAGALFVGPHAVESLGDYLAGPSHTLPTGGTAAAFSGVSVHTFLRRSSVLTADTSGLQALAEATETLATAEGLEAHRRAVAIRRKQRRPGS